MDYKNLGRSGLQVSVVGLGCNNFGMRCDYDQSEKVVHAAIEQAAAKGRIHVLVNYETTWYPSHRALWRLMKEQAADILR